MANDNLEKDLIPTAEVKENVAETPAQSESAVESDQSKSNAAESVTSQPEDFVPFETRLWHYCLRDSSDEIFWGLVFLAVWGTYWAEKWFGIPEARMIGPAYHILTCVFGVGILYYSFFLFKPFKIFHRKKDGALDPNANHWFYDLIVFIFFVTSILVLADRLILALSVPSSLSYALAVCRQVLYTVFSVFVIGNAVNLLVELFFARICTYYRLTPVLFIMKTGFFITKERRIAVWDIAQVNMKRNLWQRFLRVGTIELKIHSHGMDGAQVSDESLKRNARILYLKGLNAPKAVQDDINHYRLFVRNHMGNRFINTITNDEQQPKGAANE